MQKKAEKILTVAIPAYNAERFLGACLDSLLAARQAEQTELLVIDDGSKDRTGAIADAYAAKYPGIVRALHKENGGHGSAVNLGIAQATGVYFKVIDSDDSAEPAAYAAYLEELEKLAARSGAAEGSKKEPVSETPCDLVATPFTCVHYRGGKPYKAEQRQIEGAKALPVKTVLAFQAAAANLHVRMHEWTVRTALLKERGIKLSERSFYVDMQYILFPAPWIETVCILPYPVYRYRLGEEGQSVSVRNMQKNRGQHQAVLRSLTAFYKSREEAGDSAEVLSYLARGIAKMEANQVQIALSLPVGRAAKAELLAAERELERECPAAYEKNGKKSLALLRKSGYALYPLAAVMWRLVKR